MTDRAWLFAFGVCMGAVVVIAGIMLALTLSGCTVRGGICETDDSCAPLERCEARRCVPAPGGPV